MIRSMGKPFSFSSAKIRSADLGFTLIELMVVIAIVAVIASIATPAWTSLMARNAVRAAVNDFNGSLQFARSEAVRMSTPITLCPSSDGANCTATTFDKGWIVRTGPATNATTQVVLQDTLPRNQVKMDATAAADRKITFLPNGLPASGFAGAIFEVCPSSAGLTSLIRRMTLPMTGKVTLSSPTTCSI